MSHKDEWFKFFERTCENIDLAETLLKRESPYPSPAAMMAGLDDRPRIGGDQFQRIAETVKKLDEQGVSREVNAHMAALALGRARKPSNMEIARAMFPVEQMPPGATPIYSFDEDDDVPSDP